MKKIILCCAMILALAAIPLGLAEGNVGAPSDAAEIVTFGAYPQTASGSDSTPIQWFVLEEDDGKALLVSRYLLETMTYNPERAGSKWEESALRQWLNEDFLNNAFTEEERAAILLTDVDNSWKESYGRECVDGGGDTQDMVFLLSYKQAMKYFRGKKDRICAMTDYVTAKIAHVEGVEQWESGVAGYWWLRSPGLAVSCVACVQYDGVISNGYVTYEGVCVRPALWVDLESAVLGSLKKAAAKPPFRGV